MNAPGPLHLFERVGIELEYMIVDSGTLAVRPIADLILPPGGDRFFEQPGRETETAAELMAPGKSGCRPVSRPVIGWSNELTAHVIELKVVEPVASLEGLAELFQRHVERVNAELAAHGARLMSSGMHPWMDPRRETRLWPHEGSEIYDTYNRIFGCQGHGWANLQSVHVNLPFADDDEFGRLHAAIRLILPILPALAASSPFVEGRPTGVLDNRLAVYGSNSSRVPSLAGRVIPEPVFTMRDYQREILERMYREIAPHDSEGLLRHEWLNARGAIARFERSTIEIRLLDSQECPQADVAVVAVVLAVLRGLVAQRWAPLRAQQSWPVDPLEAIFRQTVRDADAAVISDHAYLDMFGYPATACTAGDLWRHLVEATLTRPDRPAIEENGGNRVEGAGAGSTAPMVSCAPDAALRVILNRGPLARRLVRAASADASAERLTAVYGDLCDCLAEGRPFAA